MKSKLDQYIHYASLAVILIGLVVSVYMAIYNYTDNDSMCLGSGDCSTVNASRFSEFLRYSCRVDWRLRLHRLVFKCSTM